MIPPELPEDEDARLAALRRYAVLDTPAEPAFDDLVALAAWVAEVPIALVSLVDTDRQWFKASYGLDVPETPRDVSFCGHLVAGGVPLIVEDATSDERFRDNPLVVGEPRVVFYAGVPLRTPDGFVLGSLCAIDHSPRTLPPDRLDMLAKLGRQVVQLLEQRRHVRASEHYRRLLRSPRLHPALLEGDDRLTPLSPAWEVTLGRSDLELDQVPLLDLVAEDDRDTTREALKRLRVEGAAELRHRVLASDGSVRWLDWKLVYDPHEARAYGLAHDVSSLAELSELTSHFVSIASHELRTPLTSLRGSLRLLAHGVAGELPAAADELVQVAASSADRLVHLVTEMLDLERMRSGRMPVHLAAVPVEAIFRETLTTAGGLGGAQRLHVEACGDLSIQADRRLALQAVVNLVANALTHGQGRVTLSGAMCGERVVLEVADEGPGISPADQERLFEAFYQVDGRPDRPVASSGLGLALARSMMHAQHGEIGVTSAAGQGSTFWLSFPPGAAPA